MSPASGELTFDHIWRGLTRTDKVWLALVAVFAGLGFWAPLDTSLALLARLAAYGLGFGIAVRLTRRFLRQIIWRLRNRLLVAYSFIALVPMLLLAALSLLVLYAFIGQMAIYMVNAELERRTSLLIAATGQAAEQGMDAAAVAQGMPVLLQLLPGLELRAEGERGWSVPAGSQMPAPPPDWGDAGGIVVRDGLLYAWAHIVRPKATVTATVPLTSRFLAGLAPNVGEISFLRLDTDVSPKRKLRVHRYSGETLEDEGPRNRLPDPETRWDVEVRWATAVPAFVWESPGRVENELMRIRTRPLAVLNTVFAQKVDVWQDLIPAASLALGIAFLVAEISSLVIGISITRTITGAVHGIYAGTERIREGDFTHRIRVQGHDQLASLAVSFNNMTAHIERLLVVAKENERIQADLEIAREVQAQLYPRTLPETRGLRLSALCNPARMVSGDYYDYARLDEGRLAIAVGDVAGKGISAALLMANVQSALRTQIRHCLEASPETRSLSTSRLVSQLNQHLYANTSPEKYATFCLCIWDEAAGTLTYTNAGHLPPVLLRQGVPQLLEVNGTVVGAFPFSRYQESQMRLEPGDLLLFYTDGMTEAENAYGEQFGEERLLSTLCKSRAQSPDEILHALSRSVRDWTGTAELQDDLTLLLAERV